MNGFGSWALIKLAPEGHDVPSTLGRSVRVLDGWCRTPGSGRSGRRYRLAPALLLGASLLPLSSARGFRVWRR